MANILFTIACTWSILASVMSKSVVSSPPGSGMKPSHLDSPLLSVDHDIVSHKAPRLRDHKEQHSEGKIDWEAFPNHVDHDFTYHREFLHALEKSWKGFTTVGIHHAHADINNGAFMNLGYDLGDEEFAYDTKVAAEFYGDKHYLVLDHSSADIREISDEGMLVCHADIEGGKLSAGDYIVGTGAAEFADTEHFNSWASTTNHVGPRLKRKLVEKKSKSDDSNHHAKIGFAVTREVTSVDKKDANCAFAHTKTIHPLRLFNSYDVHAKFNAVHSEKVQAHRKTLGLDAFDAHLPRRKIERVESHGRSLFNVGGDPYLIKENGVRLCDDSKPDSQKTYFDNEEFKAWDYSKWTISTKGTENGFEWMGFAYVGSGACAQVKLAKAEFNFNMNADMEAKPVKALDSPIMLVGTEETKGVSCVNCFVYTGANAVVMLSLTSTSLYKFYSKVGGEAAAGGEIKIQDPESDIASDGTLDDKLDNAATKKLKEGIKVPISTGVSFTYKLLSFAYELEGSIKLEGFLSASSYFAATASIESVFGGKNDDPSFYADHEFKESKKGFNMAKSSTFEITSADVDSAITGTMELGISLGVGDLKVAIGTTFETACSNDVDFEYKSASRRRLIGDDLAILTVTSDVPTSRNTFAAGDTLTLSYESSEMIPGQEGTIFYHIETPKGGIIKMGKQDFLADATGSGIVTFKYLVPWTTDLSNDGSSEYTIVAKSNHHLKRPIRSSPVRFNMYTETDTIFTSPLLTQHGAVISPDTPVDITWNPQVFHHYRQESYQYYHGIDTQASTVTFKLIGEVLDADGNVLETSELNTFNDDQHSFPNSGTATITFPKEATTSSKGHRFYLTIADEYRRVQNMGWSQGYFTFSSTESMLTSDVYHKVERMRAFISGIDQQAMINKQMEQKEEAEEDKRHLRTQRELSCSGEQFNLDYGSNGKAGNPKISSPVGSVTVHEGYEDVHEFDQKAETCLTSTGASGGSDSGSGSGSGSDSGSGSGGGGGGGGGGGSSSSSDSAESGLDGGAIAGIVIGCLAFVVLVGLAAYYFTHDKRFPWQADPNAPQQHMQNPQMMQGQNPQMQMMQGQNPQMQMMQGQNPQMMQGQNPQMMQGQNPQMMQGQNPQMMQGQNPQMMQGQNPQMMQGQNPQMMQGQNPQMMQMTVEQQGQMGGGGGDFVAYDNPMHSSPGNMQQFQQAQADASDARMEGFAKVAGNRSSLTKSNTPRFSLGSQQ